DLASDARDREISHALIDRDRDKLAAIDEALGRVDDGTYGLCEDCEAEIAEGRLQALPFTRLCVTCQADRERESKINKRYEEDRAAWRLGAGDSDEGESCAALSPFRTTRPRRPTAPTRPPKLRPRRSRSRVPRVLPRSRRPARCRGRADTTRSSTAGRRAAAPRRPPPARTRRPRPGRPARTPRARRRAAG